MQETLQVLFYWVLLKVGAPPIIPLPEVKLVPPAQLAQMYNEKGAGGHVPKALYIFTEKTIYLPEGFKGETKEEKSTLVHELVHHLQVTLEVPRHNICLIELDAYIVEDEWRKENGLDTLTDKSWFHHFIGKCTVTLFKGEMGAP